MQKCCVLCTALVVLAVPTMRGFGARATDPVVPKPNVILILADDQGYGDFSCHGNPVLKTPNLDRFHDESIRFTDFHVTPMCTPTRSQLLTGRDALANGAYCVCSGRTFLHPSVHTVAELFAANGYRGEIGAGQESVADVVLRYAGQGTLRGVLC